MAGWRFKYYQTNLEKIRVGLAGFGLIVLAILVAPKISRATENFYSFNLNFGFSNNVGFDKGLLVSTLQGLANRDEPNLYIYKDAMPWVDTSKYYQDKGYASVDDFWLQQFEKPGGWLIGKQEIKLNSIDELLNQFSWINKVVVWDPRVGATSNVATTIGGIENALPVMWGGEMYQKLVNERHYGVVLNLYNMNFSDVSRIPDSNTSSTGSSKANAYIWAKEKYLDTGKVDANYLGYLESYFGDGKALVDPADQITARDIVVAKKGFVFDLSPWSDETSVDDKEQTIGKESYALEEILKSAYARADWQDRIIEVFGFPAWWAKYCDYADKNSKYKNWQAEHKLVERLSKYGAGLIATENIGTNNLSFHQHYFDNEFSVWQDKGSFPNLENKTYIMYVSGDYDSASLLETKMLVNWESGVNINMPISWGINSVNAKYLGDVVDYFYQRRKSGDSFVGHVSGCIYMNPNFWPEDKFEVYGKYCQNLNSRMDINETAFILKGDQISDSEKTKSNYLDSFFSFSGSGMGVVSPERTFGSNFVYKNNIMPVVAGLAPDNVNGGRDYIVGRLNSGFLGDISGLGKSPKFIFVRKGPSTSRGDIKALHDGLTAEFNSRGWGQLQAVNSNDFYYLAKKAMSGEKQYAYKASYNVIGVPEKMNPGQTVIVEVMLKNKGEDTWYKNGQAGAEDKPYRLTTSVVGQGQDHDWASFNNSDYSPGRVELTKEVVPGEIIELDFELRCPQETGKYKLAVDMMREHVTGFREQGVPMAQVTFEVGSGCVEIDNNTGISDLIRWYGVYRSGLNNDEGDLNCDEHVNISDLMFWYGKYRN